MEMNFDFSWKSNGFRISALFTESWLAGLLKVKDFENVDESLTVPERSCRFLL